MYCLSLYFSQRVLVERSVNELVATLVDKLTPDECTNLSPQEGWACTLPDPKNKKQRCQECLPCYFCMLLNNFTQRNTEALVKCKKTSTFNCC